MTGWLHRIDAIPVLYRPVVIRDKDGIEYRAVTVPGVDFGFQGIGCDIGYRVDDAYTISARRVAFWHYDETRRPIRPMTPNRLRAIMGE